MFMILGFTFLIFSLVMLFYFVFPSLSPIPFFPTNKKDLPMIINELLQQKTTDGWPDRMGVPKRAHLAGKRGARFGTREGQDPSHTILDLGAGTGTVIFAAAEKSYNEAKKASRRHLQPSRLQFIAVEINPFLVAFMQLKRLTHPNKKNIVVVRTDMFKPTFVSEVKPVSGSTTIYMYVGLLVMERLKKQLAQFPQNTRIVSYMYEIPNWKARLLNTTKGQHSLFVYKI